MKHKLNKGEWGELYVFLKALGEGGFYAADKNLNKLENVYYKIIKALKEEDNILKEYNRESKLIVIKSDGIVIASISVNQFLQQSQILYEKIKDGKQTFEIPEIEDFLKKINISKIKSGSGNKKDIVFQIYDQYTDEQPIIGFSVKSYIGNTPTLVNSSGATVFRFKTNKKIDQKLLDDINKINTNKKIKDRIKMLNDNNIQLMYKSLSSENFIYNLELIDTKMPELLANLILNSYFVRGKHLKDVVNFLCNENKNIDKDIVEYKVKKLLECMALGMEPNKKWDGKEDASGYIIAKSDGNILGYHIYERDELIEYLYNNTKFDTPSTKRTKSGILSFDEYNEYGLMNLSLQIRFK